MDVSCPSPHGQIHAQPLHAPSAADETSLEAGISFTKYTVLFVGIIWALSPVLQTLTSTYSDDTMWALTIFFSFLHVALFDYMHAPHSSKYVQKNASMTPACTICLADSRVRLR